MSDAARVALLAISNVEHLRSLLRKEWVSAGGSALELDEALGVASAAARRWHIELTEDVEAWEDVEDASKPDARRDRA